MLPADVAAFVRNSLGSLWALELVALLSKNPARQWSEEELVRELRASSTVVRDLIPHFLRLGLIVDDKDGTWIWRPVSPELEDLVRKIVQIYAVTPLALINSLSIGSRSNVQKLADAFKIKKD